jgi:tetratricopeptide (TPR) repeat protein
VTAELERGAAVADDDARVALASALDSGDTASAMRIAVARVPTWIRFTMFTEAAMALERVLDLAGTNASPALELAAGSLAVAQDDFTGARAHLEAALDGFTDSGDRAGTVDAITDLCEVAMLQGELDRVDELLGRAREIEVTADSPNIGRFIDYLDAWLAEERGDYERARDGFAAHLDAARVLGRADEVAYALVTLAELEALAGDAAAAGELLAEAELATPTGVAVQLDCYRSRLRGMLALRGGASGASRDATTLFGDALGLAVSLGRASELSWSIDGVAACAAALGRDEDAAVLFVGGAALRSAAGAATPRIEAEAYGAVRAEAMDRLGTVRADRLARLATRLDVESLVQRAQLVITDARG